MEHPLTEELTARVKQLLEESGEPEMQVSVVDASQMDLLYEIRQHVEWSPALTEAANLDAGLLKKGTKHRSIEKAVESARQRALDAATEAAGRGELPTEPAPELPDGEIALWTAPKADTYSVSCDACEGKGATRCTSCRGSGKSKCPSCGGSGKQTCMACGGMGNQPRSQTINGQYVTDYVMCTHCVGAREINCNSCSGSGTSTCSYCGGRGTQGCKACNGQGHLITGVHARVDVRYSSTLSPASEGPAGAKAIEESRTTVVENAGRIEQTTDRREDLTRELTWTVGVPSASLDYEIGGEQFASEAIGSKLAHVKHEAFLDRLFGGRTRSCLATAQSKASGRSTLEDALQQLMTFGLGRNGVERAARSLGMGKKSGNDGEFNGAATPEFLGSVRDAARKLLVRLSEDAVGPALPRLCLGVALALSIVSLAGGWPGASPLALCVVVCLALAAGAAGYAFVIARRRIAAVSGIAPLRPNLGPRAWSAILTVALAPPVLLFLRTLL